MNVLGLCNFCIANKELVGHAYCRTFSLLHFKFATERDVTAGHNTIYSGFPISKHLAPFQHCWIAPYLGKRSKIAYKSRQVDLRKTKETSIIRARWPHKRMLEGIQTLMAIIHNRASGVANTMVRAFPTKVGELYLGRSFSKNKILDEVIKIIQSKKIEIGNSNKEIIPSIYYIGLSKTGTGSIKDGFKDNSVAHWHSLKYFERIYNCNLLSKNNYDLYDLVLYIANKYNFKPLIIECIREPVSQKISRCFQHLKNPRNNCNCNLCVWKNKDRNIDELLEIIKDSIKPFLMDDIYSIKNWKLKFNIDLLKEFNKRENYYYNELSNCKLLFIRFEDINDRVDVFKNLGYNYTINHKNKNINDDYMYIKNNIKFTDTEKKLIYNDIYKVFYD